MQTACSFICVNVATRQFVLQSYSFFLRVGEYCCLAICSVIRLSSSYLATEVITVRLERNVLCSRFQTSPYGWSV